MVQIKRAALTNLAARSFGAGKYADGQGLWLCKSNTHAGKWIVRLVVSSKRREMGLGSWPDVSIAEARERAAMARRQLRDGLDPIEERQKAKRQIKRLTVSEAIDGCFAARQAELKGDGEAGRWLSPLQIHVIPKIGTMPVEDVDQHVVKQLLEPIWHSKASTAQKAMSRMNLTLKHAAALGLDVDLQAIMKARALLGKQRHTPKHIPSMPYVEVPAFFLSLKKRHTSANLAFRFLILTVSRTSEVRFATWNEIDEGIWTIPAERTKTNAENRIPLTMEALKVLSQAKQNNHTKWIFATPTGKPLSDAAMARLLDRRKLTARPHGFRASFRTWVEEQTDTPFEVKEAALGHKVDHGIVGAYQRSDRLEKRRHLMVKWEKFLVPNS